MKIGIDGSAITKSQPTGVEVATRDLVSALLKLDQRNQYLIYTSVRLPEHWHKPNVVNRVIPPTRLWTQTALSRAIASDNLDVWWSPSNILPRKLPKKVLATVHDLAFIKFPRAYTFKNWLGSWLTVWRARRLATKIIAISQQTKSDLERYFQTPAEQIVIVPMAQPFLAESTFPLKYPIPDKFILVVGRIESRKNPFNIVYAFAELAHAHPDLHLVFAGPPTHGHAVKKLAKRYGVDGRVHLFGFVSDFGLVKLYRRAQVLLFPSLYEGFGIPILEGFVHETPVVTSNTGALKEVAGDAAVLVDPTSPASIAGGVRRLLDNPETRAHYVAMGNKRSQDFSWDKSAEKLLTLINSL
jgi:glycosyltransferase involved in cell wall biosynthesis